MAIKEKMHFIAVYGSLRKGMGNYRVNASGGGEYLYSGKTYENYDLHEYAAGSFPSVNLKGDTAGKPVVVEVFYVPESGLKGAYDSLEGYHPDPDQCFYNRTMVPIVIADSGDMINAWIYHIDEETGALVESGDWAKHMNGDDFDAFL